MTRNPDFRLVRVPDRLGFWRRLGRGLASIFGRRYYEGGKTSRLREFSSKAAGPNTITRAQGQTLLDRHRDMVRNDPHFARGVTVLVNNIVGSGITATAIVPQLEGQDADPKDVERARRANAIWAAHGRRGVCDIEGQHTRNALIALAVRCSIESGEVIVRRVVDLDAGVVPYRYEVMEPDLLDRRKDQRLDNGGRIIQGVEFNKKGRRVAYWILPEHPGESAAFFVNNGPSVRVPATDIIHLFVPLRPKQVRGIPRFAPVLATKRDFADYETNELIRKKGEAAVTAFVIPPEGFEGETNEDETGGIAPSVIDADGRQVEDMQPGLIVRLRRGKEVRFNTPMIPGGYPENKRTWLQNFAVGMGLSYEQLSGDLSQANYSSLRAGLLEFWRGVEVDQWNFVIPVLCDRLWEWDMEGAYLTGALDVQYVPVEWSAPKKQSVDPSKDSLADYLDVRAGFVPWDDKVAERGYQPDAVIRRMKSTNAKWDKAKVTVDVDPRKVAWRGAFAQSEPPADAPTDAANGES